MMLKEIEQHIVDAMAGAVIGVDPYINLSFDGCLPLDIYQSIQANLPGQDQLTHAGTDRYMIMLDDEGLQGLHNVWRLAAKALESKRVKEALFKILAPDLIASRGDPNPRSAPRAYIFRDGPGFSIASHCDGLGRYATLQVCLPPDDGLKDLGTELYDKGQKYVKEFEFLPNRANGFAVTTTSWHGRPKLPAGMPVRYQILVLYYTGIPEWEGEIK